jgi:hypothetical protein
MRKNLTIGESYTFNVVLYGEILLAEFQRFPYLEWVWIERIFSSIKVANVKSIWFNLRHAGCG